MMLPTLPLTVTPDQGQIEPLRPLMMHRRCVVVGAAPLKTRRAVIQPGEYVIAINGSISSLDRCADLWLLNSKPNRTALHATMLRQGLGRACRHVALLRGPLEATEQETLRRLRKMGCQYETWSVIDKPIKRWLEERLCDRCEDGIAQPACSAGLFAVALALWSGAEHVRLTGFSWKAGYHYLRYVPTTIRGHVQSDGRGLRALLQRYPGRLSGAIVPRDLAVAS